MRPCIELHACGLEGCIQPVNQFTELNRRLAWGEPADMVMQPAAGLVQDEIESRYPDGVDGGCQSIEVRDGRAAQKSQREMQ